MAGLHIKKDDTVVVISGKDKGKEGKVLKCQPTEGKVLVEGVNMLTLHKKPRKADRRRRHHSSGGLYQRFQRDGRLPQCKKKPTRTGSKELADGSRVRVQEVRRHSGQISGGNLRWLD